MAGPVRIEAPGDASGGAPKPSSNPTGEGVSGDSTRVSQTEPNATEKALAAKGQPQQQQQQSDEQRPDWMPEKFWTGNLSESAQKMAQSNAELEKKLGQPKKVDNPEDQPKKVDTKSATSDNKLDDLFAQATEEYAERGGSLSSQMYDAFAKAGISARQVNNYIRGQEAANTQRVSVLSEIAGGEETLRAAIRWAGSNFSDREIAAFNAAVDGENDAQAQWAVQALVSRFQADGGGAELVSGVETVRSPNTTGVQPFRSLSEQLEAQRDPRYRDPTSGWAKQVEARIAASMQQGIY